MKLFQGSDDFVLPDITSFAAPVLRILDQVADRQPHIGFDRWEHPDHPASPADLHVQPLLSVRRGDSLLVDLGKIEKRERVVQSLFQTPDRLGKALFVVVDQSGRGPTGTFFIRLQPDLFQMSRKTGFLPMRHPGQDVPHEVDLAALPGGAQPFLSDGGLDARMGVRNNQSRPFHSPFLEILEKRTPAVLGLVEHRLHSQDFAISGLIYTAGDQYGYGNDSSLDPNLLVESVDPDDRVLLLQRPGAKRFHLGVQFPVKLGDLGRRDVLDAHKLGPVARFSVLKLR